MKRHGGGGYLTAIGAEKPAIMGSRSASNLGLNALTWSYLEIRTDWPFASVCLRTGRLCPDTAVGRDSRHRRPEHGPVGEAGRQLL